MATDSPKTTASVPAPSGSTSDASEGPEVQVKELRAKVTEQAEQMKEMQSNFDTLFKRVTSYNDPKFQAHLKGEPVPVDGGAPKTFGEMATHFFSDEGGTPEALAEMLKTAAEMGEQNAIKRLSPELERSNADRLERVTQNFFQEQGVPELAKAGSRFWKYLGNIVSDDPVIRTALNHDPRRGIKLAYEGYVEQYGDASKIVGRAEQKRDASLLDQSQPGSATTDKMEAFIKSKAGKGDLKNLSLEDISKQMEAAGAFEKE